MSRTFRSLLLLAAILAIVPASDAALGLGARPTNAGLVSPGPIGSTSPNTGAFTTLSASGQITSTLATGSAPLVVASTTQVSNLNVSKLVGSDWASPGTIGSTSASTGAFTTLSASTSVTDAGLTSGRVTYATTAGLLTDSANLTFNGTTLTATGWITVIGSTSGDNAFTSRVSGDSFNRMLMTADGGLNWGNGGGGQDTTLYRNGVNILRTDSKLQIAGDTVLVTAGKGIQVKEGSNARMGNATLSTGSVTVANTSVTASTRIFLTPHGSTIAAVGVSAVSAGTSFTIKSSSGTDTNTVDWLLVEPSP